VDVEDGIGRRMVVFRRPPVRLDPKRPYPAHLPQNLRLILATRVPEFMFLALRKKIDESCKTPQMMPVAFDSYLRQDI
jgi:hypothetical protein